jgi:hypothetical protein
MGTITQSAIALKTTGRRVLFAPGLQGEEMFLSCRRFVRDRGFGDPVPEFDADDVAADGKSLNYDLSSVQRNEEQAPPPFAVGILGQRVPPFESGSSVENVQPMLVTIEIQRDTDRPRRVPDDVGDEFGEDKLRDEIVHGKIRLPMQCEDEVVSGAQRFLGFFRRKLPCHWAGRSPFIVTLD